MNRSGMITAFTPNPCYDDVVNFKQLQRMPDGIEYIRGSSRVDKELNLRYTDFVNAGGDRFMRVIGPESDIWLMLLPAWYECWPRRIARLIKNAFSPRN